jgi:hypothetical protein
MHSKGKSLVTIAVMLPIAGLHFVTGEHYSGPFPGFVNGYLLDILLPFGLYILLCSSERTVPFLRPWWIKALPVLAVGFGVEIAQFTGAPIFGRTYDPLDFVMYGIGVGMAVVADRFVLPRIFPFWESESYSRDETGRAR